MPMEKVPNARVIDFEGVVFPFSAWHWVTKEPHRLNWDQEKDYSIEEEMGKSMVSGESENVDGDDEDGGSL